MIFILLPAYNEEGGIKQVLNRIGQLFKDTHEIFRIVVVDDGSRDRTSQFVREFSQKLDIKLFVFEQNQGVGEVFKTGFKYICDESLDPDQDICIILDADNTQDPRVMTSMIDAIRGGEDIVIASRFKKPGMMRGCSWTRHLYSHTLSLLMGLTVRLRGVKDYSMFFRAYRVRVLKQGFQRYGDALLAGRGFSAIAGCLVRLSNVTHRIVEVPFVLRYGKKRGKSGIRIFKTILGYFELIGECIRTDRYRKWAAPISLPVSAAKGGQRNEESTVSP
ncbi:MAG: glycosyltransferase family 2 protein [Candidatus Omnitrophica bacterium]|nr:glycosyltransferase family 2 protein [Candidatus Omnitrophota bacterium]